MVEIVIIVLMGVVVIRDIMVIMVIRTDPGHRGQTGETSQRGHTDLTLGVDFPGNFGRAAFAILAMFCLYRTLVSHLKINSIEQ